jgi:sulfhydrogenase subunit gamma (sulfur reductase)
VTVICGPPVMIRFTLPVFFKLDFSKENIITSLEMRMKCGIGKCGRCYVGEKYVCKDGPVFSLAELDKLTKEY